MERLPYLGVCTVDGQSKRELYNWVVLLSSCSARGDLWGLEIAECEAVSGSSLSKRD